MRDPSLRDQLERCHAAAVAAVDARTCLGAALAAEPTPRGPVYVIAVGKAAHGMAAALVSWLENAGVDLAGGVVVADEPGAPAHHALQYHVGEHPVPGHGSARAADALHHMVALLPFDATVHVAISGGASSLIAGPLPGLAMHDVSEFFALLLGSGLAIADVNALRKRVTRWSAGRLALACQPAAVRAWVISDVPGDDPATIASGPCVADPWTTADVRRLLETSGLGDIMPTALVPAFERETPKAGLLAPVECTIVASNATARIAAAAAGRELGFVQRVSDTLITGDAATAGRELARDAMRAARQWAEQNDALADDGHGERLRPLLLVWGGETTVTLGDAPGMGGRCQELALAAAEMLEVTPSPVALLAGGTDGRDGPTDAAGAVVDPTSWGRMVARGVDAPRALANHDAYRALDAIGALLRTGRSGTNVMDVMLALVPVERRGGGRRS